jgi:hypothetical protein
MYLHIKNYMFRDAEQTYIDTNIDNTQHKALGIILFDASTKHTSCLIAPGHTLPV